MELLDRFDPKFDVPVQDVSPDDPDLAQFEQMANVLTSNDLEVLAAPQIGISKRFLLARDPAQNLAGEPITDMVVLMLNPKIEVVDFEAGVILRDLKIHTSERYSTLHPNHIILRWTDSNGKMLEQDMYGIQAAIYDTAVRYLSNDLPWIYKKLI